MDIIFNCSHCEQELSADSGGAGSEIKCPSCGETIIIPAQPAARAETGEIPPAPSTGPHSAMSSSAASKIEMHLKVPVHDRPSEVLVKGGPKPLEVTAKGGDKTIRVKTIRHTDCIEVGHDKFDEVVSGFLMRIGEPNIISINPLSYTNLDIGTQKLMTEYAVMVVYKG